MTRGLTRSWGVTKLLGDWIPMNRTRPKDDRDGTGCNNELDKYDPRCGMSKEEFEWRWAQHKRVSERMPHALHKLNIQLERTRQYFLDDPDALRKWDEYADDVSRAFKYSLHNSLSPFFDPPDSVLYRRLMKSKARPKSYVGMLSEGMDKLGLRNRCVAVAGAIITLGVAAGLAGDQWKKQRTKETKY